MMVSDDNDNTKCYIVDFVLWSALSMKTNKRWDMLWKEIHISNVIVFNYFWHVTSVSWPVASQFLISRQHDFDLSPIYLSSVNSLFLTCLQSFLDLSPIEILSKI